MVNIFAEIHLLKPEAYHCLAYKCTLPFEYSYKSGIMYDLNSGLLRRGISIQSNCPFWDQLHRLMGFRRIRCLNRKIMCFTRCIEF